MNKEIWKPVVDYENLYEVSNFGQIRTLRKNGRLKYLSKLSQSLDADGYYRVGLYKDGKVVSLRVHQIEAKAFLGLPSAGLEVNHKDGNKKNNLVSNFEYVTRSQNVQHAYDMGLKQTVLNNFQVRVAIRCRTLRRGLVSYLSRLWKVQRGTVKERVLRKLHKQRKRMKKNNFKLSEME